MTLWSPQCHKCGARANVDVDPPANMVFAGRLRPEATKPYAFGHRVRCTRCHTWFTLSTGTEWKPHEEARKRIAEPDHETVEE